MLGRGSLLFGDNGLQQVHQIHRNGLQGEVAAANLGRGFEIPDQALHLPDGSFDRRLGSLLVLRLQHLGLPAEELGIALDGGQGLGQVMGDQAEKLLKLVMSFFGLTGELGGFLSLLGQQHSQRDDQQEGNEPEEPTSQGDMVEKDIEEVEEDGEEADAMTIRGQ